MSRLTLNKESVTDEELLRRLAEAKKIVMTPEMRAQQMLSWVTGNLALSQPHRKVEDVRADVRRIMEEQGYNLPPDPVVIEAKANTWVAPTEDQEYVPGKRAKLLYKCLFWAAVIVFVLTIPIYIIEFLNSNFDGAFLQLINKVLGNIFTFAFFYIISYYRVFSRR